MSTSKKLNKITIIVIQDERRLCSFKLSTSFLTICLVILIGLIIVSFTAVLFHNRLGSLNKEELTARVETQPKPAVAKNTESVADSAKVNAIAQIYSLSIENFEARFNLTKQSFRYSFLLKNKNSKNTTASGYIFVILKSEGLELENWLVNPQTVLLNGVPQNFKDGDPFSIIKHKVINKNITTQYTYNTCEIFVFSNEGDLVLRETFNLKHQ
ncbi:MAG TPA: hypothetical protein VEF33_15530 [Syntrophales bacterium]|nr:hypothetical protein [Syntrophales bacterium]